MRGPKASGPGRLGLRLGGFVRSVELEESVGLLCEALRKKALKQETRAEVPEGHPTSQNP